MSRLSLLKLVEKLGCDMSGFNHTSVGSFRNMLLLLRDMIQNEVISAVTGPFGVMVDDMTDIANLEQMIGFIHYYNRGSEKVEVKLLCLENVLASPYPTCRRGKPLPHGRLCHPTPLARRIGAPAIFQFPPDIFFILKTLQYSCSSCCTL